MAQFLRPSSDTLPLGGSGTGTFADIDEVTFSDADYITSNDNTNVIYETLLSSGTDPVSSAGHIVRWREAQADGNTAPSSGGSASSYDLLLYQGATLIATCIATTNTNEGSFLAVSYTLTATEANNITNYADLRLHFDLNGGGGSPANRRGVAISWAEMELPDPPPTGYTTNYDKGSLALTGKVASLERDWTLEQSKGSFTYSGKVASLSSGKTISLSKGSFTLDGKVSGLIFNRHIIANKGSIILSGKNADLYNGKLLTSNKGSFTLSGKVASFFNNKTVESSKGSFTLSGKVATFTHVRKYTLYSAKGSFVLSGKDTSLTTSSNYIIVAGKGSFILDGKDADLFTLASNELAASKGSYVLTGKDIDLLYTRTLSSSKGSFDLIGKNADLNYGLVVDRTLVYNTRRVVFNNKLMTYNGN